MEYNPLTTGNHANQRITHLQYAVPHLQEKRQASQRASVVVWLLAS